MDPCLWGKNKWKNANKKDIESCNRYKERVYDKKGKGISVVKRRLRKDVQVYKWTFEKMAH